MKFSVIFVLFIGQQASAVIYRLNADVGNHLTELGSILWQSRRTGSVINIGPAFNVIYPESEYATLPALIEVEKYEGCLREPGDAYCYVDARLFANESSSLLHTIQEFSMHNITHFDRRIVHRGICVRNCLARGDSRALRLESCLNDSLYRTHRLQSRVIEEKVLCTEFGAHKYDYGDYAAAASALLFLFLASAGSVCDFFALDHVAGSSVLLCFSLRRNWRRLVAASGDGPDPRLRRLKCFNGIKLLTTLLVILGHSPLSPMATTNNPDYFEMTYHSPIYATMYSGTLIVQTFFVMSGFLLAYNVLRQPRVSWDLLPKGIVLRWLRLTPPYAAVLLFVCTWQRHLGSGPFWTSAVEVEVKDCRRDWFYSLLYVNNYIDGSQCIAQAWYLAADMQLSALGLAALCVARSSRAQRVAASVLLALGILAPAAHTFFQNLNAILLVTPEVARNFFVFDPTFNNLYKRGHTNIACYVVGMVLGATVLRLQERDFDITKYKKYRYIYWAFVPFGVLQVLTGAVFYTDGLVVPLGVRVVYSTAIKLVFGVSVAAFVAGCVLKLEDTYRGILEWRGWAAPARLSYCAYLVHASVLRNTAAAQTSLVHSSFYTLFINYLGILGVSFMLALPCWMLLEAPAAQLVKVLLGPGETKKEPSEPTSVVVFESKKIDVRL